MKKTITTFAVAALLSVGQMSNAVADPAEAYNHPVKVFKNGSIKLTNATKDVKKRKVWYAEEVYPGHTYVVLNNGATFDMITCEVEDGRNCFWNSHTLGNGRGRSFVDIKGKAVYVPRSFNNSKAI